MSRFRFVACLLLSLAVAAAVSTVVLTKAAEPAAWQTAPAVQVTVPPSAYAEQAAAAAASTKAPAATKGFKTALGNAAAQAFREGKITRWQLARLRMAIAFRADAMAEAQACVIDQGCSEGWIKSSGEAELVGFDWAGLLAFLKELLPLILQIISVL